MTEFPHTPGEWWYECGAVYSDKGCILEADRENKDVRPTEHDSNVKLAVKAEQMYRLLEQVEALDYLMVAHASRERLEAAYLVIRNKARQLRAEIEKGES